MDKHRSQHLWFTEDLQRLFLIPERTILPAGLEPIRDLGDLRKLVSLEALSPYSCSQVEAKAFLLAAWQEALEEAKQAWLDLATFSDLSGQGMDAEALNRQIQEGMRTAAPRSQDLFEMSRDLVQSVFNAAQAEPPLSEAEGRAVFKRVFSQLPHLIEQFGEAELDAAAEDPDAWAEKLHRQVFGEQERAKRERRKQELADEIRASIDARLVAAGMKPLSELNQDAEQQAK